MSILICEDFANTLQGEGKRCGYPSLFIRTFGCNLCCVGFGQPDPSNPKTYHKVEYEENISPKYGCDSPRSWHQKFKHLCKEYKTSREYLDYLIKKYGYDRLKSIVITGGEPLLWQDFFVEFFKELRKEADTTSYFDIIHITFETNGIIKPSKELIDELFEDQLFQVLWSVSPKLNCVAGVDENKSINIDTLTNYANLRNNGFGDIQFKFVYNGDQRALDRVKQIEWELGSYIQSSDIMLMPVGAWENTLELKRKTFQVCVENGYVMTQRLHVELFGSRNGI